MTEISPAATITVSLAGANPSFLVAVSTHRTVRGDQGHPSTIRGDHGHLIGGQSTQRLSPT